MSLEGLQNMLALMKKKKKRKDSSLTFSVLENVAFIPEIVCHSL